jgi:predicted enzyme related to lactoylglutathione lyase
MAKGKLRHLAISVPDKEKAAKFYEETFGFEKRNACGGAIRTARIIRLQPSPRRAFHIRGLPYDSPMG